MSGLLFKLDDAFVAPYADRPVPFGFEESGFGEFTFRRTYSRRKADGSFEEWVDVVRRVVEGWGHLLEAHAAANGIGLRGRGMNLKFVAERMFDHIFHMKFSPPGRGLWSMGTKDIVERKNFAKLYNCAFISTKDILRDPTKPFRFLMDHSMLGVGVGFDERGANQLPVYLPAYAPPAGGGAAVAPACLAAYRQQVEALAGECANAIHAVRRTHLGEDFPVDNEKAVRALAQKGKYNPQLEQMAQDDLRLFTDELDRLTAISPDWCEYVRVRDSREGWVASLGALLNSYFRRGQPPVIFDYGGVRAEGAPLSTGGIAPGPRPLLSMHLLVHQVLTHESGGLLSVTGIFDLMNIIGKCVVAGGVRRSAEIGLGEKTAELLKLKDFSNPRTLKWGWASNNSCLMQPGDDYSDVAARIAHNGEPGIVWLSNMRRFGRADTELADDVDGENPCGEQPLKSMELCNLVETFPSAHSDLQQYLQTLKYAYLYGKVVTLVDLHWPESDAIQKRNRRIGISQSGVVEFLAARGKPALKKWCLRGYEYLRYLDREYSAVLGVGESVRLTSVKPSGTVSLLRGCTSGIHWPVFPFAMRHVRVAKTHPILGLMAKANYHIEDAVGHEATTAVVRFPVRYDAALPSQYDISIWEKIELAAFMQRYWSDNAVSVTVSFDRATEGAQVQRALEAYDHCLKGVSFLPYDAQETAPVYPQMPWARASAEEVDAYRRTLLPVDYSEMRFTGRLEDEAETDAFCDGDRCQATPLRS